MASRPSKSIEDFFSAKELDQFVDKVYSKVVDLAQKKNVPFEPTQPDTSELDVGENETSCVDNVVRLEDYLNLDDDYQLPTFNNTCPICFKSYERAQFLIEHFNREHLINRPLYECSICNDHFKLDDYVTHLISDAQHRDKYIMADLQSYTKLFLTKIIQDCMVGFFLNGAQTDRFYRLKNDHNHDLIEQFSEMINRNFFDDKKNCHTSLEYVYGRELNHANTSQIYRSDIVRAIFSYFGVQMPALTKVDKVYSQCRLCCCLFNSTNELTLHLIQVHTNDPKFNKCIACNYCRQILKANSVNVNPIDLYANHKFKNECFALNTCLGRVSSVTFKR